jgi:hypothetical protein
MSAFAVPSSEPANNPTVQAPYDEQVRLRKRVSVLEKPTNTPDGSGPVSQAQLTAAINTRAPLGLSNIAVLDFPNILAGTAQTLTITVTGAVIGDTVALGPPPTLEAGLVWGGVVSSADTVAIRLTNITAAPINPASATWKASVIP